MLRLRRPLQVLLTLVPLCAAAQTVYVTDRLAVPVRERPGRDAATVALTTSDTPVERLQRQGAFSRIRLPDGTEGWVEDIYLTPRPTAAVRLAARRAAAAAAREREPAAAARSQPAGWALAAGVATALLLGAGGGYLAGRARAVRRMRARLHGLEL